MKAITDEVFDEILNTLKHARVFISSRQKMHPDGIKLHEDLIAYLENASQPSNSADADEFCECGSNMGWDELGNWACLSDNHRAAD
ncbi:MAG: hypothetical protein U5L07_13700 [Desulfobacterales bacterium]|nr:hypothetical protein [Desulfobacterales bacterium]